MHEGDAGHHVEQFTGNMVSGTDAGRRHVDVGGIGFGIGDEFGDRLDRYQGIYLTIGTVRVACCIALMLGGADVRMTSGVSATISIAYLRKRSASPAAHRTSMLTLRPTAQPASCRPCRNAATRLCPSGSSAAKCMSTPMRRIRSRGCCARAASGHTAAAPPSSVMKWRRLMLISPLR